MGLNAALFGIPTFTIFDDAALAPLNVTERSAEPTSPSSGDIYLDDGSNTGSGNPGWRRYTGSAWEDITAAAGGGSPGGADTQLQYNNGGSFGGASALTYDDTNGFMTLSPSSDGNALDVQNVSETTLFRVATDDETVYFEAISSTAVPAIVDLASGQSGDAMQVRNSSSTTVFGIGNSGYLIPGPDGIILGDPSGTTWGEGNEPASRQVGVVADGSNNGLVVKAADNNAGNEILFGVYNRFGSRQFEVLNGVVRIGSAVDLVNGTTLGTFFSTTQTSDEPAILIGNDRGTGLHPLTILRADASPDGGKMIHLSARVDEGPRRAVGDLYGEWAASADASRKGRTRLTVSDSGGEREALRAESDGADPLLGFYGVAATSQASTLTAKDTSSVDATYGTEERDVIQNNRTRISEIEIALQNLGLIASP